MQEIRIELGKQNRIEKEVFVNDREWESWKRRKLPETNLTQRHKRICQFMINRLKKEAVLC